MFQLCTCSFERFLYFLVLLIVFTDLLSGYSRLLLATSASPKYCFFRLRCFCQLLPGSEMRELALLVRAFVQASKFPVRTSKLLVSGFWPLKIPEAFCQESKFRFLAFQIPEPFFPEIRTSR